MVFLLVSALVLVLDQVSFVWTILSRCLLVALLRLRVRTLLVLLVIALMIVVVGNAVAGTADAVCNFSFRIGFTDL